MWEVEAGRLMLKEREGEGERWVEGMSHNSQQVN